jgi:hypothetical protein
MANVENNQRWMKQTWEFLHCSSFVCLKISCFASVKPWVQTPVQKKNPYIVLGPILANQYALGHMVIFLWWEHFDSILNYGNNMVVITLCWPCLYHCIPQPNNRSLEFIPSNWNGVFLHKNLLCQKFSVVSYCLQDESESTPLIWLTLAFQPDSCYMFFRSIHYYHPEMNLLPGASGSCLYS